MSSVNGSGIRSYRCPLSPHAVLRDYVMTDIRDLVNPFAVRLDFAVPGYATSGDDLIVMHMPLARNLVQSKRLGRLLTTAAGDDGMPRLGEGAAELLPHPVFGIPGAGAGGPEDRHRLRTHAGSGNSCDRLV